MLDLRSRFGFHATPFTREIPVERLLRLSFFEEALDAMERSVSGRHSMALIAPAGTGKTALLRALGASLPEARFRWHYVKVTDLSKRDMCREIAAAVGAEPAGSYPMLVRRLQEHFLTHVDTDGLRPVLVLDDAHDLRPDVARIIRVLTNFEMDSRLVVSVVLAGQPPLRKLLQREALDEVARRLALYAQLRPMSREETTRYIEHRCTIAGATTTPFDSLAVETLYEIGRGNLRATDRLALVAIELACSSECDVVDHTHVIAARPRVFA